MAKRMIVMLVVVAALAATLGIVKLRQIREAEPSSEPKAEAVTTIVAGEQEWPATLSAIGTVTAVQGVTLSADLPGTVDRIAFESGASVPEGAVLVELDMRQERAQLAAAEADRALARLMVKRMQAMLERGVISQTDYDRAKAEDDVTAARVGEVRAAIERKTIRAPFAGILGIRQVNLGQYLSAGTPVVPLQSLDPIYVNFGVPQQEVGRVGVGRAVRVAEGEGASAAFEGRITAIDSLVDPATRNVQVQATLANPTGALRPGMFVQTEVSLDTKRAAVALPASAISYAPYGDSVFVVADRRDAQGRTYRGVRQQFVELGGARGDQIVVTSGVTPGEEIVTSGVFKLRDGVAVHVDNAVQPGNERAPRPEEG